jgi:flavorubredoxin
MFDPLKDRAYIVRGGLPRVVLPDLAWVGGCSAGAGGYLRPTTGPAPAPGQRRAIGHEPCVAHLILGSEKTLLLDSGHYAHWWSLDGQLDAMLRGRPLDYVFLSHQEIPHTGNMGRLLGKYPKCVALGDVRDYHLFHPEVELDRIRMMKHEERVSLGDRDVVFLDAIWKDLSGTMWAYDTKLKLFFGADLFGFIHTDEDNVCGTLFHEMSEDDFQRLSDRHAMPFFGRNDRDQQIRVQAFRNLLKKYPIEVITSGHVGPIMGPRVPIVIEKVLAKVVEPPAQPARSA